MWCFGHIVEDNIEGDGEVLDLGDEVLECDYFIPVVGYHGGGASDGDVVLVMAQGVVVIGEWHKKREGGLEDP